MTRRPGPTISAAPTTMAWLIAAYKMSSDWERLAPATRKARDNVLRGALDTIGGRKISEITQASIEASVQRRMSQPFGAKNFLKCMRGLFSWAKHAGHVQVDPARDVKWTAPRQDNEVESGFPTWTLDDITAFEKKYPVGTRERLAFTLLLYTGLRRGDAARLGPRHLKERVVKIDGKAVIQRTFFITTEKTRTPLALPVIDILWEVMQAGPVGDETYIAREDGRPRIKEAFGNWFSDISRAAGVKKSAHGLRKAAAVRLAENGATHAQLMSIFGWKRQEQADLYIKAARQEMLARDAATLFTATR